MCSTVSEWSVPSRVPSWDCSCGVRRRGREAGFPVCAGRERASARVRARQGGRPGVQRRVLRLLSHKHSRARAHAPALQIGAKGMCLFDSWPVSVLGYTGMCSATLGHAGLRWAVLGCAWLAWLGLAVLGCALDPGPQH